MKDKRVIMNVNGGIGRCIAFTGVLNRFKQLNPDTEINLLTSFPDVFFNNLNVNRIYHFNTPYIYEDVISKMKYVEPEPYKMYEYYAEGKHITNCFNIEVNKEDKFIEPQINISETEDAAAKGFVGSRQKEVILYQPYGSMGGKMLPDESFRSLRPDFAEKLCKEMNKKYEVIMIKDGGQQGFENTMTVNNPIRNIIALIPHVKAIVGCDSFLQHAAYAMKKPAFVFWSSTRESNLGYPLHKNHRKSSEFLWTPVRIFSNDPSIAEKNKHINMFDDKDMKTCMDWIATQKQKIVPGTIKQPGHTCNTCAK